MITHVARRTSKTAVPVGGASNNNNDIDAADDAIISKQRRHHRSSYGKQLLMVMVLASFLTTSMIMMTRRRRQQQDHTINTTTNSKPSAAAAAAGAPTTTTAAQQQQQQQQQLLVVITPTYTRQKLNPKSATRVFRKYTLSQMFISMCYATTGGGTDVWWYLIDENISDPIPSFADKCAHVHVTRLPAPPPSNTTSKHRGVDHRNTGLEHALRDHKGKNAAVYFADDDNLYAPTLWATAAGASHDALLWPVGWMEDKDGGDAPVHTNGEIHGFQTKFCGKRRKFAIDMAGFAVPLDATANVKFQHEWDKGLLETSFLEGIELQGVRVRAVTTSHDVLAWHVNWKTDDVKNFVMNMPSPRINCAWAKKKNASVG